MRTFLVVCALLLAGCSSRYSDHGNITQVSLTAPEQKAVADDVAATVFATFGSRGTFDFAHGERNAFAQTLGRSLRAKGIGLNGNDSQGYYPTLRYQLIALNPQQFYVTVRAGALTATRLWSTQDGALAPLSAQARMNGGGDAH